MHELSFECFGVRTRVVVSQAEDLEAARGALPPHSRAATSGDPHATLTLLADSDGAYELSRDADTVTGGLRRDNAFEVLERELRAVIALESPDHVFVHAGAVAHAGKAIVIPGTTHAGKTALVAALVRSGATYYSDEYAPLDGDGMVHPFAKPLSLRDERFVQTDHTVESLGGVAGDERLQAGLVVLTTYREGAEWLPERLSGGAATLELLSHTIPAQSRPTAALRAISRCIDGATVIQGTRGEADAVAPMIIAELERGP